jgi:hypothetical protein
VLLGEGIDAPEEKGRMRGAMRRRMRGLIDRFCHAATTLPMVEQMVWSMSGGTTRYAAAALIAETGAKAAIETAMGVLTSARRLQKVARGASSDLLSAKVTPEEERYTRRDLIEWIKSTSLVSLAPRPS